MWLWSGGFIILFTWVIVLIRNLAGLLHSVRLTPPSAHTRTADETDPSQDTATEVHQHQSFLDDGGERDNGTYPLVSVVLTGRNEGRNLPATLGSLRNQTWPNLEVIVVNDRSTDNTKEVLSEIKSSWPELYILHITELPRNWLGKTYALHTAAKIATGDYLLFTDADVTFSRYAISTAIGHMKEAKIDHLALSPKLRCHGFWLRSTVYFFLYNVVLVFCPQNAERPNSAASVGIGAFNLMQRAVYEQIGGHKSVALRPDDDLAIGAVIKADGFRQQFAGGTDLVSVEWYESLAQMMVGLEKNAMAPFHYRFLRFFFAIAAMLIFYDGPAIGFFLSLTTNSSSALFALALALEIFLFHLTRKYSGISFGWSLTPPLAAPILAVILLRAGLLCAIRGGIQWRDTFYSLKALRKVR